jgi:hypothetical protein
MSWSRPLTDSALTLAGHAKREGSRQPDLDYRSGFGGRFNFHKTSQSRVLGAVLSRFQDHRLWRQTSLNDLRETCGRPTR